MKNTKSHTAQYTATEPETSSTAATGCTEYPAVAATNGITPYVVGYDDGINWGIIGKYSALGSANVSDAWSTPLINSNRNVIIKKNYTQAKTVPDGTGYNASATYYDPIGIIEQNIEVKATPAGKDLITPCDATAFQAGETRSYLPYPAPTSGSGAFRSGALSEQESYYATKLSVSDPKAYVRQKYEISTRGRLTESTQPGLETTVSKVYDVKVTTTADKVLQIAHTAATGEIYVKNLYWGASEYPVLLKKTIKDEDGRQSEIFENENGQSILSRRFDGGVYYDTYYVYDELDQLVYVISPQGSSDLKRGSSYDPDSALVVDYCFCYQYDARGRNVGKRVPGKEWEYCVYDTGGRIILLQDANMRRAGEDEDIQYWIKYDYDSLGRMVSQTMNYTSSTRTRQQFQALADEGKPTGVIRKALLAEYRYDSAFEYEYRDITLKTDRWLLVYDLAQDTKWPAVAASDSSRVLFASDQTIKREFLIGSLLTPSGRPFLAYYIPEDYAYLATALVAASDKCAITQDTPMRPLLSRVRTMVKTPFSFEPVQGICSSSDRDYRTRGLKTQENVAILSSGMAASTQFVTRLFYYDSRGRIIQIVERNPQGGVSRYSMKYDFNGRVTLMQETHQRTASKPQSDTKRTVYSYDTRGRILSQTITLNQAQATVAYTYDELGRLFSRTTLGTGNTAPIEVQYKYDLRGLLTSISCARIYSQQNQYSPTGNITRMILNAPYFQVNNVIHTYQYDAVNQMRMATRSAQASMVQYQMNYDLNGNITSFLRDKRTLSKSIAQYYTYNGNRILDMQRTATDPADSPGTYRFGYDDNGNWVAKRGENGQPLMDLEYNYLNLTDAIITQQGTLVYSWLADGTKVKCRQVNGSQESGTVYLGSLRYDYTNTTLSVETLFDGGIVGNAQEGDYSTLYVEDHLGSVRVLVSGAPMLLNEYEPFGMLAKEYSVNLLPQLPAQINDRLFNGKQELFPTGESLLDYGARIYDPSTARWIAPDPLAYRYSCTSPYVYCLNNPVRFTDPTGMIIDPASMNEWNRLHRDIDTTLGEAEHFLKLYEATVGNNPNDSNLMFIKARIAVLKAAKRHMSRLEASKQVYALNPVAGSNGATTYDPATNIITLTYGSDALFVHELTHAWQFEKKKFGYNKDTGWAIAIDTHDEAEAFAAQWAIAPDSVNGLNPSSPVSSMDDITPEWVAGIRDINGTFPYGPEGKNKVGQTDITIRSLGRHMQEAYHWIDAKNFAGWERKSIKTKYKDNLYYKK